MSDYRVTEETASYEVGVAHDVILAACRCGAGDTWPNKGLGRAHAAAWKTRHQHLDRPALAPAPTDDVAGAQRGGEGA